MQYNPRFKKRITNESPSTIPRVISRKVSTPKLKEEKGNSPYVKKSTCPKCGRNHKGKCLVGFRNFYECAKSNHMKRDFPMIKD